MWNLTQVDIMSLYWSKIYWLSKAVVILSQLRSSRCHSLLKKMDSLLGIAHNVSILITHFVVMPSI